MNPFVNRTGRSPTVFDRLGNQNLKATEMALSESKSAKRFTAASRRLVSRGEAEAWGARPYADARNPS